MILRGIKQLAHLLVGIVSVTLAKLLLMTSLLALMLVYYHRQCFKTVTSCAVSLSEDLKRKKGQHIYIHNFKITMTQIFYTYLTRVFLNKKVHL